LTDPRNDTWLRERVGDPADDLYFAALFAHPRTRPGVTAAAALYVELEAIATRFRDLNVARTKLAWWREELGRLDAGQPAHPVTRALADASAATPVQPLLDLVTGMELILLEGPVTDIATARMRAERGLGPFATALVAIVAPEEAAPGRFARVGEAAGLARGLGAPSDDDARAERASAARSALLESAALAREAPPPLQVLVALAWRRVRSGSAPDSGRRTTALRVLTAWRAGRGRLPRRLRRA